MSDILFGGGQPTHGQTLGSVEFETSNLDLELLDINLDDRAREIIEVTNMKVKPTTASTGYGNRIKIPSAYEDPGKMILLVNHDPTQFIPTGVLENITAHVGPATSAQEEFACFGFISKVKHMGPLDGKVMTSEIEVTLTDDDSYDDTGAVTWTGAS